MPTPEMSRRTFFVLTGLIGLLLPCNVVVQDSPEGGVLVSIADPRSMLTLVQNSRLEPVVEEAERRLRRVIDSLD